MTTSMTPAHSSSVGGPRPQSICCSSLEYRGQGNTFGGVQDSSRQKHWTRSAVASSRDASRWEPGGLEDPHESLNKCTLLTTAAHSVTQVILLCIASVESYLPTGMLRSSRGESIIYASCVLQHTYPSVVHKTSFLWRPCVSC